MPRGVCNEFHVTAHYRLDTDRIEFYIRSEKPGAYMHIIFARARAAFAGLGNVTYGHLAPGNPSDPIHGLDFVAHNFILAKANALHANPPQMRLQQGAIPIRAAAEDKEQSRLNSRAGARGVLELVP
jgi:hypothetical protein